jgi:pimeloyl-ACP methyl ester carboxylesterase
VVGGNYLNRIAGYEEATDVAEALLNLARQAGDLQVGAWEARYDVLKEALLEGIHPSRRSLFQIFAPPSGQRPSAEATDALAPALAAAAREAAPHSDPRSSSERISIPVCLVHGRGDRLIPFTESLRLAQAFPGKARVRVYLTGLFSHSQADSEGTRNGDFGEQLHFLRILAELLTLVD